MKGTHTHTHSPEVLIPCRNWEQMQLSSNIVSKPISFVWWFRWHGADKRILMLEQQNPVLIVCEARICDSERKMKEIVIWIDFV